MASTVGPCREFQPDELAGYEKCTFPLPQEDDGELCATLVRTSMSGEDSRPAVLYLHGFVDYFFQDHVARAIEGAGYRFYALDLRRYGRSLRASNRANWALHIDDYFPELTLALEAITARHPQVAGIVAHSTGSLIAAHYLARGGCPVPVGCLVMNSPFFRFFASPSNLAKLWAVVRLARLFPKVLLPENFGTVYGSTLHVSERGSWSYDLKKKPLEGFPLYSGWFRMIVLAQRMLGTFELSLPILVLHSDRSKPPGKVVVDDDFCTDTVLNVEDMKRWSTTLGPNVTVQEIPGGMHDLLLSAQPAREQALAEITSFLQMHDISR